MLMVRKDESLDLLNSATDEEHDELVLTRTDADVAVTSQTNSTQRSNNDKGIPGEFEKRISDIKAKLNQIKNSINTELDTKPNNNIQVRNSV